MHWENVNLDDGTMVIDAALAKNAKTRTVYLTDEAGPHSA